MADAPDRRERLLNLLAALLESRAGLTRDELATNASLGYPENVESARRAFERDKASLRAMGVPLREDALGNESRYRVDPKEYYLPDLHLTPGELQALHVAVTAVALGSGAGEGALMKLGGIEGQGAFPIAELPVGETLPPLFDASRRRAPVEFTYRGRVRDIEPWRLMSKFGQWYVVGLDRTINEMRVFRTDRIEGEITVGTPRSFDVPEDFRADAYLEDQPWQYGPGPAFDVAIQVDAEHLAAFASRAGPTAAVVSTPGGGGVVTMSVVNLDGLRSFVLGFLEHAEVLSPPEARAAMVTWLEAIAAQAAP